MNETGRGGEQGKIIAVNGRVRSSTQEAGLRRSVVVSSADAAVGKIDLPVTGSPVLPEGAKALPPAVNDRSDGSAGFIDQDPIQSGHKGHNEEEPVLGTVLDVPLEAQRDMEHSQLTQENESIFQDKLAGELQRRFLSGDSVTINYPWIDGDEIAKVSGVTSADGSTHFVIASSLHINASDEIEPKIEKARVLWLDEPTMIAGEILLNYYPFSGYQVTNNIIDFTNGDGYNELIVNGEIHIRGIGASYAGEDFIRAWLDTGGVIYDTESAQLQMSDAEKETILEKLITADHNQTLTDAVVQGYEDDLGAENTDEAFLQGVKPARDLRAANDVFDAIIGTDEESFAVQFETVGRFTPDDMVTAVTTFADSLLMEHGIEKRDSWEKYSMTWETSQGKMQMDVRNRSVLLHFESEDREIGNTFSFYPGAEPSSSFYDSQSQTPGDIARSSGIPLLMLLSFGNPELARKIEEKMLQTPEEFKKNFRGLRWMLANMRGRGEAPDEDGKYRAVMPDELDSMVDLTDSNSISSANTESS